MNKIKFWKSDFSEEEIHYALDKIKLIRSFTSDGKVTLSSSREVENWVAFLISATGFTVRTTPLRKRIIIGVLFSPELKLEFSEIEVTCPLWARSLNWALSRQRQLSRRHR